MGEYTPTTADDLEAVVEEAALANVGANMLNPYDTLAAWLAAHDAKVRAEQREADARIAESDQFYDARGDVLSSDEVSYNAARREAAAAIRAGGTDEQ